MILMDMSKSLIVKFHVSVLNRLKIMSFFVNAKDINKYKM